MLSTNQHLESPGSQSIDLDALFRAARLATDRSYSPYSRFRVGAALLCEDGSVVTGANVENRSFGLTICAERSAVVAAVSSGRSRYLALAVCTPDAAYPVSPCGACRQVLGEFADPSMQVVYGHGEAIEARTTLGDLLPFDSLHELSSR
ncbi:MAG TPA: cytidine deaminase [Magnetospirillaceae bacterium]|nr:cytidine deaminase [Magnetospirillaceae bacterium]